MKLHIVPASTGLQWVKLGMQTFWHQPMALTALLFISMAAVSLIGMFPIIGPYIALLLMPSVFLVMMLGAAEASQQRTPRPDLVVAPFRAGKAHVQAMLVLGVFYSVGIVLITLLTSLADDGTLAQISLGNEPMTPELAEELVQQPGFQIALWSGFVLYNLLAMLMWHAPALVHWHGVSPLKSLFFSALACWINKAALLVYFLGWAAVFFGVSLALVLLGSLVGGPRFIGMLLFPMAMLMSAMFFTSVYFTFRDSFETDEGQPPS